MNLGLHVNARALRGRPLRGPLLTLILTLTLTLTAACFDLEKVLSCPHGEVSSFYYHRKLSVYNFTVYDLGTGDGNCYIWPDVVAQRGANETASCLMDYIQIRAAHGTKIFDLFSDNGSGQNRNVFCS